MAAGRLLVSCRSQRLVIILQWLVMPAQEQGADTPFGGLFSARIPRRFSIHVTLWDMRAPIDRYPR